MIPQRPASDHQTAPFRRVLTANIALAVTFALVMMLAFELDRAGVGLVSVNQQPMIDLYLNLSDDQ